MNAPLGLDIATLPDGDLDPRFELTTGPALVGQDLRAELLTTEAALWYDASYGLGIGGMVAKRFTDASRAALASRIEAVCMRDDRVAEVDVTVSGALVVDVRGITSTGEAFAFVCSPADLPDRLETS